MYAGALLTRVLSTPGLARWVVHLLVLVMYVNRVSNCSFVKNSLVYIDSSATCVLLQFLSGIVMGGAMQNKVCYRFTAQVTYWT